MKDIKELKIIYKKLSELKKYENNPRMNDKAIDKVAKSIENYGFKVPIIIDKNNIIVCGHTRYSASEKLGIDKVPCIIADDLSEKQIKAFRIADNKVSDYSIWDNKLLLQELSELEDIFTGFNESEIFNDILDETNNSVLKDNEEGVIYNITFKSQDKNLINEIKLFIKDKGGIIEC